MKRKVNRPNRQKTAKPLFFVANPNISELKWLDEQTGGEIKEAKVSAAVEQHQAGVEKERKQVSIHTVSPSLSFKSVIPHDEVKAPPAAVRKQSAIKPQELQQHGLHNFSFKDADHVKVSIPFDQAFSNCDYTFVATVNLPFCYAVLQSKSEKCANVSIIRSKSTAGSAGCLNWIAVGEI